jgi:hypothetical protein
VSEARPASRVVSRLRLAPHPLLNLVRRRLLRRTDAPLQSLAKKSWEIAPGTTFVRRPAYFLPGQLERVTGWAYMDDPRQEMQPGADLYQKPTRGFLLDDAWLIDGTVYKGSVRSYLSRRSRRFLQCWAERTIDRAALCGTYDGLGFFGLWLTDDCTLVPLAEREGVPVTSHQPPSLHMQAYEAQLGLRPERVRSAYFRELVLFDDLEHNRDKGRRFEAMRDKLLAKVKVERHPGVFILRRNSGKRRVMHNELEVAEHLQTRRGYRVVDVTKDDLPTIVGACAGAEVVAGVEGSHLMHGLLLLERGRSLLALQPPHRFCSVLKRTMDRDGQHFAFVVCQTDPPANDGFRADLDEVERTLDLLPRASP